MEYTIFPECVSYLACVLWSIFINLFMQKVSTKTTEHQFLLQAETNKNGEWYPKFDIITIKDSRPIKIKMIAHEPSPKYIKVWNAANILLLKKV